MKNQKVSQEMQVLDYLSNHNGITSYEAFLELGISQLAARIFNLKARGYLFKKVNETYINASGVKKRYDRYFLIKEN